MWKEDGKASVALVIESGWEAKPGEEKERPSHGKGGEFADSVDSRGPFSAPQTLKARISAQTADEPRTSAAHQRLHTPDNLQDVSDLS